ncbi:hypothetical protein SCAR479_12905 [Seiridium cardinale]|uniref:Nucleoside diphosphate kinase n=1 Tax=Seiridium cardinale TaxID=138064 RepID=A0ABR2X9N3_9PEZI
MLDDLSDRPPSIFSPSRGKKANVLGQPDRRQASSETRSTASTSGLEDPAGATDATRPPGLGLNSKPAQYAHAPPAPAQQTDAAGRPIARATRAEANQAQARQQPRHGGRPLTLYFFLVAWLLFFCLFLLPWQLSNNRPGWNFTRSVKHDLSTYTEALKTLVSTSSPTAPSIVHQGSASIPQTNSTSEQAVSHPEPEIKMATEQTFIAIKPDGVQRGLVGPIISRFENRGYKLVALKLVSPTKEHLETHYADLKEKPFFPGLVQYMLSGPIAAMVWEGRDAVKTGRTLLGATNPLASAPGTIRGDFAIDVGRNVCHGSDSVENAKKEIALWFKEGEVLNYQSHSAAWIYEKA